MPALKTLKDLPQFIVSAMRRVGTSDAGVGSGHYEIDGKFNSVIPLATPDWFFLLIDGIDFCVNVPSLGLESNNMTLGISGPGNLQLAGKSLAYLGPRWRPYQVWIVLAPVESWHRKKLHGEDGVAEDYDSGETSIVGGREVRVWTKVQPAAGSKGLTRYYPAADQTLPPSTEPRPVSGAWDHEHCALCDNHIDAGEYGYCNANENWLCEKCYERYAVTHDLGFIDEL